MILFLLACSDYRLDFGSEAPKDTLPADDTATVDTDTTVTPVTEACNGLDDDGDGAIDEDFSDLDADGAADCVDPLDCALDTPAAGLATDAVQCGATMVEDPWNVSLRDDWVPEDAAYHYLSEQLVTGNFNDDDGDGQITADDLTDIVVLMAEDVCVSDKTRLVVLSGADLSVIWEATWPYLDLHTAPAVGDIDGDGLIDVVVHTDLGETLAYDHEGSLLWSSEPLMQYNLPGAALADLDGDGDVEVIDSKVVFSGATGDVDHMLADVYTGAAIASDLDQDGQAETLFDGYVYDAAGNVVADAPVRGEYPVVWDLDGDPSNGEVVWAAGRSLTAMDAAGKKAWSVNAGGVVGPPAIADLDGDGAAELIAAADDGHVRAWDKAGQPVFDVALDLYGRPGVVAGDLDNDGDYELVLAGTDHLYILDGDGTVRFESPDFALASHPAFPSHPVLSDLDGDGSTEILHVIEENEGPQYSSRLLVWRHTNAAWPKMADSWDQFSFTPGDRGLDGAVPARPAPSWVGTELFRGWPSEGLGRPDLRARLLDVCAESCEPSGVVGVSVQIENVGAMNADAGVPVTLYREDGDTITALSTLPLPAAVPAGKTSDAFVFTITAAELGASGLRVVIDDDGSGAGRLEECVDDDNAASFADLPCR